MKMMNELFGKTIKELKKEIGNDIEFTLHGNEISIEFPVSGYDALYINNTTGNIYAISKYDNEPLYQIIEGIEGSFEYGDIVMKA